MGQYYLKHYGMVSDDEFYSNYLEHYGILGMKCGVRRYQNPDGSLTAEGRARYGTVENYKANRELKKRVNRAGFIAGPIGSGIATTRYLKEHDGKIPTDSFKKNNNPTSLFKKSKKQRKELIDDQKRKEMMDDIQKRIKEEEIRSEKFMSSKEGKKIMAKLPSIKKRAVELIKKDISSDRTGWGESEFPNNKIRINEISDGFAAFDRNGEVSHIMFDVPTEHGWQEVIYEPRNDKVYLEAWND